jgi:cytochrome c oxidase assembly protein subunit 15
MSDRQQLNIALWLLGICVIIFCMISLGGVTRLTGSGLSMVQWAPITGVLPPRNDGQWLAVFKLYQASPEFVKVNAGLDLEGFKSIFWFEYFHRLLGRLIGILFFLPMVYFFVRYPLPAKLRVQLIGLLVLGGLQGLMGWYMVKSGLVNDPHVSQYRLVAHLALALVLYIAIFWLGSAYFIRNWTQRYVTPVWLSSLSLVLLALVFITILAGGFVAGTRAGFAFNTFPLMNGALIPEAYAALEPFWRNLFENIATVQFNHRLLATLALVLAAVLAWLAYKSALIPALKRVYIVTLLFIVLQYSLGILVLINYVPVSLGAIHQAAAVLVMTSSLFLVRVLAQLKNSSALDPVKA